MLKKFRLLVSPHGLVGITSFIDPRLTCLSKTMVWLASQVSFVLKNNEQSSKSNDSSLPTWSHGEQDQQ